MFATKLQEYGERLKIRAREEGRLVGRDEGRREGVRVTARNLREQGVDLVTIAQATGLSTEEIEAL